jgi:hypothetical protein
MKEEERIMEKDEIGDCLQLAIEHLDIALSKTKTLMQQEDTARETARKWDGFFAYLFGELPENPEN